jgi:hypothetical protein
MTLKYSELGADSPDPATTLPGKGKRAVLKTEAEQDLNQILFLL